MGLQSFAGDYRIQAPVENAFAVASGLYVSCWVRFTTLGRTNTIFRVLNVGTRGWVFRTDNSNQIQLLYVSTTGNTTRNHTPTVALTTGSWYHIHANLDAAGNSVVGVNGEETTAAGDPMAATGSVLSPTILHHELGTSGHEGLCEIAGLRVHTQPFSVEQRQIDYRSQGAAGIVAGALAWLPFLDASSGTDTNTVMPQCPIDPSRPWAAVGTGPANTYQASPYPRRSAA